MASQIETLLSAVPPENRAALAPQITALEVATQALRLAVLQQLATSVGLTLDDLRAASAPLPPTQTSTQEVRRPPGRPRKYAVRIPADADTSPPEPEPTRRPAGRSKPRRVTRAGTVPGQRTMGLLDLRVYDVIARRQVTTHSHVLSAFENTSAGRSNAIRVSRAIKCLLSLGLIVRESTNVAAYRLAVPQPPVTYAQTAAIAGVYLYLRRREGNAVPHTEIREWFVSNYANGARSGWRLYNAVSNLGQILRDYLGRRTGLVTRDKVSDTWAAAPGGKAIKTLPKVLEVVPVAATV